MTTQSTKTDADSDVSVTSWIFFMYETPGYTMGTLDVTYFPTEAQALDKLLEEASAYCCCCDDDEFQESCLALVREQQRFCKMRDGIRMWIAPATLQGFKTRVPDTSCKWNDFTDTLIQTLAQIDD